MITSTAEALQTLKQIASEIETEGDVMTASYLRDAGLWLASEIEVLQDYKFRYESVSK